MKLYRWDSNVGEILAQAASLPAARRHVLATLVDGDAARSDLVAAIAGPPEVVTGAAAVVAWHQ